MHRCDVQLAPRLGLAVALAAGLAEGAARADSCTTPDLLETIPAEGADSVPTNATLSARYALVAQYEGETVTLEHVAAETQEVAATFDSAEAILSITPPAPLVAGDSYIVHWPALHGLDTANVGSKTDQHFRAGPGPDTAAPSFAGITSIAWDVARDKDPCTSSLTERYVFDLSLGEAADDGGRDSLTLLVFQTAGPQQSGTGAKPVLVQAIPAAGGTARVTSTVASTLGHVCFTALVRDLTGKVSPGSPVSCVDTVSPPFFYGCAVAPGRGSGPGGAVPVVAICAAGLCHRARRRKWHSRDGGRENA